MRISTQQQYLSSIDNMQQSQSRLADLQNQISTGKKLNTPSDDPVAAAQVVKLDRELAQYEKFDDNINVTERRLQLEDTIVNDINIATDRMRELAIKAGNTAVLTDSDRKSIATELRQVTDYIAGLMNTQDSEGEYLFAGSKGTTKPYVQLADGSYEYQGDDGQRMIQVGPENLVASNDSGLQLFEGIDNGLKLDMSGAAVAAGDQFMLAPGFDDAQAEKEFTTATEGLGELTLAVTPTGVPNEYNYRITDSEGNLLQSDPAVDLSSPAEITFNGLKFNLQAPADPLNDTITFSAVEDKTNLLDVAQTLATALEQPIKNGDSGEVKEAVAKALTQFREGSDRLVESRASLGGRLKSLEFVSSSNQDFKLQTESAKSTLVDTNLPEAISKLTLEQATLQAAQATFGRVASLSLFNYLN